MLFIVRRSWIGPGRGELFWRGEKEVGRAIVNKASRGGAESSKYSVLSLAELWKSLIGWAQWQEEEVLFLPIGLCSCHRAWELPLLVFQLYFNWGFYLLSPYDTKIIDIEDRLKCYVIIKGLVNNLPPGLVQLSWECLCLILVLG